MENGCEQCVLTAWQPIIPPNQSQAEQPTLGLGGGVNLAFMLSRTASIAKEYLPNLFPPDALNA